MTEEQLDRAQMGGADQSCVRREEEERQGKGTRQ